MRESEESIYSRFLAERNEEDLRLLLERHREGLTLFLFSIVHSMENAEELMLDAFARAATLSGFDSSSAGEVTVTVSYTEGDIIKTVTFTVTIVEPVTTTYTIPVSANPAFSAPTGTTAGNRFRRFSRSSKSCTAKRWRSRSERAIISVFPNEKRSRRTCSGTWDQII